MKNYTISFFSVRSQFSLTVIHEMQKYTRLIVRDDQIILHEIIWNELNEETFSAISVFFPHAFYCLINFEWAYEYR